MQKLLLFAILLFFGTGAVLYFTDAGEKFNQKINQLITYSNCEPALRYKIGEIDKRFKLSEKDFLKQVSEAEGVWEKIEGKNIFAFDPEGTQSASERLITINAIYDSRQGLNTQISQLEQNLSSGQKRINTSVAEYEKRVAVFQTRLADLNNRIQEWNNKGGAPPDEYEKLKKEQEALQTEANELNALAATLDITVGEYNQQINKLNNTVFEFNRELQKKPEEGLYDPERDVIEIYLVSSPSELIHTIAHELGHAIEIPHVDNPKAIMYPFTSEFVKPSDEDVSALKFACRTRNLLEERLQLILSMP